MPCFEGSIYSISRALSSFFFGVDLVIRCPTSGASLSCCCYHDGDGKRWISHRLRLSSCCYHDGNNKRWIFHRPRLSLRFVRYRQNISFNRMKLDMSFQVFIFQFIYVSLINPLKGKVVYTPQKY